ncbi:MAG TPA: hypothetical protein VEU28_09980 [Actinomycetota bacterium]|nr:hypothetical protein [Actinomycetota bacterium]
MSTRNLALVAAVLAGLFLVLNFTVEGAGTVFLILAVLALIAAGYLFSRTRV